MEIDYDVIIIGSGPSGAACAKYLVDSDLKVLIIEEKSLPRDKCCSGLYSERAVKIIEEYFGIIPKKFYCKNDYLNVVLAKRPPNFISIKNFNYYNLKRNEIDYWLVNQSGADLEDKCKFINLKKNKDWLKINCMLNNKKINISCKYLVGADGAGSDVRNCIDMKYKKNKLRNVYQGVYKGNFNEISKKNFHIVINKEFSNYFASYHIKDDLLFISTSLEKNNKYYKKLYKFINDFYNTELLEVRKEWGYTEDFNESKLYFGKNNIFVVGEATGMISAFSEGVPTALITGNMAAKSILSHNKDKLKAYTDSLKPEIKYISDAWENASLLNFN